MLNDSRKYDDWTGVRLDIQVAALFVDRLTFVSVLKGFRLNLLNKDELYRCTGSEFSELDTIITDADRCSPFRLWFLVRRFMVWMKRYNRNTASGSPLVRGSAGSLVDRCTAQVRY